VSPLFRSAQSSECQFDPRCAGLNREPAMIRLFHVEDVPRAMGDDIYANYMP
jgi:hypothetical protein